MSQPDDLAFDISVCIHADEIVREEVVIWGVQPVGLKPLRRLDDGSLRSAMIDLPAGWSSGTPISLASTQQIALLSGDVKFGDETVGSGAFLVVPAGADMPVMTALDDSCLILIQDKGQAFDKASGANCRPTVIADAMTIEPFTPIIDGVPLHGFERRVLWIDPETGADTRLLRVPAGFQGAGANWHPVQEEIFCLEGDIQPDDTRPMRVGSFLWNPARSIHGFNEVTRGGCVLLEWHDGKWDLIRS
ncbi:uncharacterized protein DUF4437 [Novosphingobium kunmingense]|uniref:Uncharacterized protein DUF4437 n=1 Tax=Novosphingobium kunmingense TaxID=1211806 RepID=A0A2N0H6R0_9SPHN|nr:DUF4437 domain-containing protein [Novosphingobium kunmingense]PKB14592.1 uncharacterized protein DUF4437 [Novosphingobium kunmingense]